MRIALVAMSGIRVVDAELLRVGLTLPGFVERSKTIASLPSLGLLTLAALTPAEHEVRYFEVRDLAPEPDLSGFDLVAISSYSAQIGEAYALASRLRDSGRKVVLGGPHVSVLPEEALRCADTVAIGEGETVWPELVSDAARGRLAPTYGSLRGEYDLSLAPVPAFELLDISRYNRLTLQTSRGCPHLCEFCAGSVVFCPRYKQKPVSRVLAEVDRILELWAHPFLEFADDNALVRGEYWRELLPQLARRKVRWFAETDLSVADDEELLRRMRESGCAQVLIGLESPLESGLAGVEMRADWKLRQWSRYREAIACIQSQGIAVNGCFVLGLDGHTPEIFDQVLAFAEDSGLEEVQVTIQTAFPGTPLHARLEREGRILEKGRWDKCTLFDVNFTPRDMSVETLVRRFRALATELYSEERTRRRRERFRAQLRGLRERRWAPS